MDQRLYIVAYDISDQKRWRRVFKLMKGFGEWMQLSVFQCRLTPKQHAELIALLDGIIHHTEDHILLLDFGHAENVSPRVVSLGKTSFTPIEHEPVIV
ncbi:CRISPR-associated endonuclease Cas2 [Thiocapsa roseopersicina]|uniref:CRISPR-associated endoribonuclease Cas2 n=1 Tax=Thiocapsa roseopersicina TaxID=1058 RepID=A0A1H3A7E2_THIRO|nr:CRISPR-associated endonuclease Cas2 [Thiocapsa roseopersicina]SDX25094.1 CRISPR-associated protein, Cas2 family [Thiocapsa roseopersicina]